jgi:hypothetical protein
MGISLKHPKNISPKMIGDGSSQKRRREGFEFLFGGNERSQKLRTL